MTRYVLGFAFTEDRSKVVLIRKDRGPQELVGKLNGVGGKIEPGESVHQAMCREFKEETGVEIPAWAWRRCGKFSGKDYRVEVLTIDTDGVHKAKTQESERVYLVGVSTLPFLSNYLCHNVQRIVDFCLERKIKFFTFEEVA